VSFKLARAATNLPDQQSSIMHFFKGLYFEFGKATNSANVMNVLTQKNELKFKKV